MKEKRSNYKQWFDKGKYDLDAARDMLEKKKYDYCAFFCHQAIEKTLKSYFIY